MNDGVLDAADLESAPSFPNNSVDYENVIQFKMPLLEKSLALFKKANNHDEISRFGAFCLQNAWWLDTYALFMALKEAHGLTAWKTWEADIRSRQPGAIRVWQEKLSDRIEYHQYLQFQFHHQWFRLKHYCQDRGIKLMGDIPIFVALDSAEVWSHPEMFYLDEDGRPTVQAGVPPDYFSKTGQLWGNPLYRWDVMAQDGYRWWVERFRYLYSLVDIIRLDHFRGFEAYWEVPGNEKVATSGRWVSGPGARLFLTVRQALGELPIVAEDLGIITPEVEAMREQFGFPGMKVLQFAFGGDPKVRPFNYPRNCVVYSGTHDNNTTIGWFKGEDPLVTRSVAEKERERQLALDYLGTDGHEINWDFIRLALMSVADTAIIPLQDVLGLGGEARMNRPSSLVGNWRWRFTSEMLTPAIAERLRKLTAVYGR